MRIRISNLIRQITVYTMLTCLFTKAPIVSCFNVKFRGDTENLLQSVNKGNYGCPIMDVHQSLVASPEGAPSVQEVNPRGRQLAHEPVS